jgi:nucleoside-diphosphate-sugar epimerase
VRDVFKFYDSARGENLFRKIEWVQADVLDIYQLERALEGVESIYHTAALVSYQKKDRKKLIETNVKGTANLVNLAIDSNITSFCHISSIAALGMPNESGIIDEESKWNRNRIKSNYALSKYLAEREVWRGCGEGLNTVIVNPSIILGPAKADQSSGSLMHLLKKGISYYPEGQTGYVDVRDVSKLSLALVERKLFGERYVLNAENLSFQSILELAAGIFNNEIPKIKVGRMALEAARIADSAKSFLSGKAPKITSETIKSAMRKSSFSSEKIRSELDWEFIPVEESLKYYSTFSY